ncbi:MAG: family 20 glycosylhydrolase [Chitinophagaceae bacterium]|nr:family 20 glycosylhydrolase [Chitinophagaceae bacterium]
MRITILVIVAIFSFTASSGQVKLPYYPDSIFNTYYKQRVATFLALPKTEHDIVFVGNSITEGGSWSELFNDIRIKNRGINGDISAGVIHRLDEIIARNPEKIFLKIGINDLSRGVSADSLVKNILIIADFLNQEIPSTGFFVQSLLPVSEREKKFLGHANQAGQVIYVNKRLSEEAKAHHYQYVDLFSSFCDSSGRLDRTLTNDGLHLVGNGYLLWKHVSFPYVYGLQQKPSIIPQPQQLKWNKGYFPLYDCHTILINDNSLLASAGILKNVLATHSLSAILQSGLDDKGPYIKLNKGTVAGSSSPEAYQLLVTRDSVLITANTPAGMDHGIRTLSQLMRDGTMIDNCLITDWPAFSWRGFMIDVGRNYVSIGRLKELIRVMAQYKLNVFHFHLTEDIAWRLAVDAFPALTDPQFMQRDKGLYYSKQDIKELINYCREYNILFIPEIDMPGHSAAFKRALNADMQSDTGKSFLLKIVKEINESFDLSYFHIGADEVRINDSSFVPQMVNYLKSIGKTVIGWQPGGNYPSGVIRQLWMDDKGSITGSNKYKYIDSRHLYLNHMDPLEAVTTIFNRQIASRNRGDDFALGAELCVWHDRAVVSEKDIFNMNPVYPGILAFAERCWVGGGKEGWIANISDGNEKAFFEFEDRLMDQRWSYFRDLPFPYVKQDKMTWALYGPYDNGGNLEMKFPPEEQGNDLDKEPILGSCRGGTIILRHWWAPLIKGAVKDPRPNTSIYAVAKIWSDREEYREFWIGFNDISRSPSTDSPPENAWDERSSKLWVNGKIIEAPQWKRPGQKGNSEIPLQDEGYSYRPPVKILLNKGWNKILIKAPVGSFKGRDWHNPVKWMFSFAEVN